MGLFTTEDGRYQGWLAALLCCCAALNDDEYPKERNTAKGQLYLAISIDIVALMPFQWEPQGLAFGLNSLQRPR